MKPYILPLFFLNFVSFLLVCVPMANSLTADGVIPKKIK